MTWGVAQHDDLRRPSLLIEDHGDDIDAAIEHARQLNIAHEDPNVVGLYTVCKVEDGEPRVVWDIAIWLLLS